jgi:tRNA G18 (ribose-2'-O)-methylase SpoU
MEKENDNRAIKDCYKGWINELIANDIATKAYPYAILMTQLTHDFNIGSLIRSANGFGAEKVFYIGKNKKYDRRGAVGSYKYMNVIYLDSMENLLVLKNEYSFIALENLEDSITISNFSWKTAKKPLILIGEECNGLSQDILNLCDYTVSIPMAGSIRSFNAAVAGSIAMYDLTTKLFNKESK